jgi:hypothetical protein
VDCQDSRDCPVITKGSEISIKEFAFRDIERSCLDAMVFIVQCANDKAKWWRGMNVSCRRFSHTASDDGGPAPEKVPPKSSPDSSPNEHFRGSERALAEQ